jgi:hypothetical protein
VQTHLSGRFLSPPDSACLTSFESQCSTQLFPLPVLLPVLLPAARSISRYIFVSRLSAAQPVPQAPLPAAAALGSRDVIEAGRAAPTSTVHSSCCLDHQLHAAAPARRPAGPARAPPGPHYVPARSRPAPPSTHRGWETKSLVAAARRTLLKAKRSKSR